MRKRSAAVQVVATVGSVALLANYASASLLTYEPFDYTPAGDPIVGQTNTTSANSPVSWVENTEYTLGYPVHTVNSGNLPAPTGFAPSVGNSADLVGGATRPAWNDLALPNQYGPNTTLYYSVLLKVSDLTGLTVPNTNLEANNDGLVMFGALNTSGNPATNLPRNWAGELVIRQGSTSGTYNLGIRASSTLGKHDSQYTAFTGDITANSDTHLIVVRYTQGSDPTSLTYGYNDMWVDPSASTFGNASAPGGNIGVAGSPSVTVTTDTVIGNIQIGSGITAGSTPDNAYIDELRVGTTWADVTPSAVPEPASMTLLGIGALGLLGKRRRRT